MRGCHRRREQGAADNLYQEAQGTIRCRLEHSSCSMLLNKIAAQASLARGYLDTLSVNNVFLHKMW